MPESAARKLLAGLLQQISIVEQLLQRCQEDGDDASTLARLAEQAHQRVAEVQAEVTDGVGAWEGTCSELDSELQLQIAQARTRFQDAISSVLSHHGALLDAIEVDEVAADPGQVESADPGQKSVI